MTPSEQPTSIEQSTTNGGSGPAETHVAGVTSPWSQSAVGILREIGSTISRNEIVRNPWIWGALAICALLVLAAVYAPGFSTVLHTVDPGLAGWAVVLSMSLAPAVAGQLWLAIASRRR